MQVKVVSRLMHAYAVVYPGFDKGGCLMICMQSAREKLGDHAHFRLYWVYIIKNRPCSPLFTTKKRSGEQLLMNWLAILKL